MAAHIPLPIVAIDPQGAMGLSIDLCRLEAARPGHGMPHCHAPPVPFDPSDGVWLVDLASGRARLLLPFAALLQQALRGAGVDQLTGLRAAPVGLPSDVQVGWLHHRTHGEVIMELHLGVLCFGAVLIWLHGSVADVYVQMCGVPTQTI